MFAHLLVNLGLGRVHLVIRGKVTCRVQWCVRSHGDYRRSSSTAQIRKSGSPGVMWMFPTTLFTRTRPARLQPSDDCSWIWSDQCSSTHYALSESACDVKERKTRSTPGQSQLGFPKLQPFRTHASQTASHSYSIHSRGFSAAARTTVTGRTLLVQLVDVVTELTDREPCTAAPAAETSLDNTMCDTVSHWSSPIISIKSRDTISKQGALLDEEGGGKGTGMVSGGLTMLYHGTRGNVALR
jgi:hypothetical protein